MTQTPEQWQSAWAAQIGRNVAALRDERGKIEGKGKLSALDLSERCAAIGYPIARATIANLENGRKASVTVQEVAVLARALGVPPVRLLFDVAGPRVAVLPGEDRLAIEGAEWFAGNEPLLPDDDLDNLGSYLTARDSDFLSGLGLLWTYRELLATMERWQKALAESSDMRYELEQAEKRGEGEPDILGLPTEPVAVWRGRHERASHILHAHQARMNELHAVLRRAGASLPFAIPVNTGDDDA